jgi:hypothetical protein
MKFMKLTISFCFAIVLGLTVSVFADEGTSTSKKSLEQRIKELEEKLKDSGVGGGVKGSGIKISGYVDTSYIANINTDRTQNGPVAGSSSRNNGRVFDNQMDAFNLNAVKLTIQKDKDSSKFPAGFRVDTMYGEDANVLRNGTAINAGPTPDSTLFLEQAYVNLGVPIGNGIDVKMGKMVSLIGYEVIESPANWQFSRSDAFRLSPFTQTGATFGYQWNDHITSTVGVVNGWDQGANGSVNYNTDLAFVGRIDGNITKTSVGDFNMFSAGYYGNDDTSNTAGAINNANTWVLNHGLTWDKPFNCDQLTLGFDHLHRESEFATAAWAAAVNTQLVPVSADAFSQYAKWDWNKWLTSSYRFSYTTYHNSAANGGVNVFTLDPLVVQTGSSRPVNTEVYSFALTQAFNVWKDTLVRLEWRHDWTPTGGMGFGQANAASRDDIRKDQDTLAVNVVYSF